MLLRAPGRTRHCYCAWRRWEEEGPARALLRQALLRLAPAAKVNVLAVKRVLGLPFLLKLLRKTSSERCGKSEIRIPN